MSRAARSLSAAALALWLPAFGCTTSDNDDTAPACVDVDLECQPIVSPPTFDAIYANVLQPSCASGAGLCHGSAMSAAGLDMRTVASAFDGLSTRVDSHAIGCSLVLRRIESSDSSFRMPPGPTPLSEAQRCAIRQWIANGGQR